MVTVLMTMMTAVVMITVANDDYGNEYDGNDDDDDDDDDDNCDNTKND